MRWMCVAIIVAVTGLVGCASDEDKRNLEKSGEQTQELDPGSAPPEVTVLTEYRAKGMRGPTRVAVTSSGQIVVADTSARKVFVLSPTGDLISTIDSIAAPLGLAVGAQDRLYVADKISGAVSIMDLNGGLIGQLGQGPGEFQVPNDIAYDPQARVVYVVDSKMDRVGVYDEVGVFKNNMGGSGVGDGQLAFPVSLHLDTTAGHLYVSEEGNHRITVFDRTGAFVRNFGAYGNAAGDFTRPQGITQDEAGRIYVVDTFQGQLQVLDREGGHLAFVGTYGKGPRQLSLPVDAVFSQGRLLVTSHGSAKVVVFGVDDFVDPTPVLPADVYLDPPVFNVYSRVDTIQAVIEVPTGQVDNIIPASAALNGVPATTSVAPVFGDADGDGVRDLTVHFQRAALLRALGEAGAYELDVLAEMTSGERVEAKVSLEIVAEGGR